MLPHDDHTVLLVDPGTLPDKLAATLEKRGFVIETAEPGQVAGMMIVSVPALVVSLDLHRREILRTISSLDEEELPQYITLVPRGEAARLRSVVPQTVTGLLPEDTPVGAIVARAATLVRRKTKPERQLGGQRKTMLGLGEAPPPSSRPAPPPMTPDAIPRAVSGALRPSSPPPAIPPITTKAGVLRASSLPPPPHPPSPASRLQSAGPAARQRSGGTLNGLPQREMQSHFSSGKLPPPPATPSAPPPPTPAETPAPTAPRRASSDSILPGERISLHLELTAIPQLRVALLHDEANQADAIASGLRSARHEVLLLKTDALALRWEQLRQFVPHALVIDERALAESGGSWLKTLREDPFLADVSLVAAPFATLHDPVHDRPDLSPLAQRLDSVNRSELSLLSQLSASAEIELPLSQITAARLISLLSKHPRPTRLLAHGNGSQLTCFLRAGALGHAKLQAAGTPAQALSPQQALNWLLHEELLSLSVTEKAPDADTETERPARDLLKLAYAEALPAESALLPHTFTARESHAGAAAPRVSPAPEPRFESSAQLEEGDFESIPDSEPPPAQPVALAAAPALTPPALAELPESPEAQPKRSPLPWVAAAALLCGAGLAVIAVPRLTDQAEAGAESSARPARREAEQEAQPRPPADQQGEHADAPSRLPAAAEPAAAEPAAAEPAAAGPAAAEPAQKSDAEKAEPPATGGEARYFAITAVNTLATCEDVLGKSQEDYAGTPSWKGSALWKRSRQRMMVGDFDGAHALMCQAAFVDPSGPASVGLGNYYLARRDLKNAEQWAAFGLEHRPETKQRKSKELMGDVLSQRGRLEEALGLWLETMKLDATQTGKLRSVARALTTSARSARRGGDSALAERLLRRAVVFDPANSTAAGQLSYALLKNDEPAAAQLWAQRSLEGDKQQGEALLTLARLAIAGGDTTAATDYLKRVPRKTAAGNEANELLRSL